MSMSHDLAVFLRADGGVLVHARFHDGNGKAAEGVMTPDYAERMGTQLIEQARKARAVEAMSEAMKPARKEVR